MMIRLASDNFLFCVSEYFTDSIFDTTSVYWECFDMFTFIQDEKNFIAC